MKTCSKCKEELSIDNFRKDKSKRDGLSSSCKSCKKKVDLNYHENNKEFLKINVSNWNKKNPDYRHAYYKKNKERLLEKTKKWKVLNRENVLKKQREYRSKRRIEDNLFRFNYNLRSLISNSFKRSKNGFVKNNSTEQILGCTIIEFREYVENKFTEGMSFDNHGEWHLDHIVPLASATTEEEIIKLNHYTNFQPLWAEDNLRKGSKI